MTTKKSSISGQDYSDSVIKIRQLNNRLYEEIQKKDFLAARVSARQIAVEAMHIGVWCKEAVDTTGMEM